MRVGRKKGEEALSQPVFVTCLLAGSSLRGPANLVLTKQAPIHRAVHLESHTTSTHEDWTHTLECTLTLGSHRQVRTDYD